MEVVEVWLKMEMVQVVKGEQVVRLVVVLVVGEVMNGRPH